MKVYITGADGFIGTLLVNEIVEKHTDAIVVASCLNYDLFDKLLSSVKKSHKSRISFAKSSNVKDFDFSDIDVVVHLAFARQKAGDKAIAESIDFSLALFKTVSQFNVRKIINISSQGIYGCFEDFRTLNTPPAPNTTYSMAKYATEQMLDYIFSNTKIMYTSLRLDNIIQSQNLVVNLCKDAKYNGIINLIGGSQFFSYLDVSDAVSAIMAVVFGPESLRTVYNVGHNKKRYGLLEIANIVSDICLLCGYKKPTIHLIEKDIQLWAGMDTSDFCSHFNWAPSQDIKHMVENIFLSV